MIVIRVPQAAGRKELLRPFSTYVRKAKRACSGRLCGFGREPYRGMAGSYDSGMNIYIIRWILAVRTNLLKNAWV